MRLLALETSEYVSSVALWEDGAVRELTFPSRMDLCEKLTARIQELLGVPRALDANLTALAVSLGPGSFTGLRVGLATAKALAHVCEVPLIGIPTQEVLAAAEPAERVLVLQSARRGHVYAGLWTRSGDALIAERTVEVVPVEDLMHWLQPPLLVVGPATEALDDLLPQLPEGVTVRQTHAQATVVARLAAPRVASTEARMAARLQPLYLLPSQAERMKNLDVTNHPVSGACRNLRLRRATLDDLPAIMHIENRSFSRPWREVSMREELANQTGRVMLLAEVDGAVAGYAGCWLIAGEAHVFSVAVDPEYRRCGLAELLMLTLLDQAQRRDTNYVILEYRVSNTGAAELYRKLGFVHVHRRKNFYEDPREDAFVAAIPDLNDPQQQQLLKVLRDRWLQRHDYETHVDL